MIDPNPRLLADGLGFPEGPVALGDGAIAFTDIRHQRVARYEPGEGVGTIAETGGGPNGATLGADGALYVANNGGLNVGPHGYWFAPDFGDGRIQRISVDGELTDLVPALPGEGPHRPNDVCFGPDGQLYFTDPANWEDLANLKPGRIWRARHDGSVEQVAEIPSFPNGIAFGPGGSDLYVAQSMAMTILRIPWRPDGLGDPVAFATLPKGFPDGFCFSVDGDLFVCGSMGETICVFDSGGALIQQLDVPTGSEPTNCCLMDGTLVVTLSAAGTLVALDAGVEALPLFR